MRNTTDMTGGKAIAVFLLSISDVSAINPLVAFYDINGGKRDVPDTTRDLNQTAVPLGYLSSENSSIRALS
jgi:hypothetical protein